MTAVAIVSQAASRGVCQKETFILRMRVHLTGIPFSA